MRSVDISKRFMDKRKEEKSLQLSIYQQLDKSLAITAQEDDEVNILI